MMPSSPASTSQQGRREQMGRPCKCPDCGKRDMIEVSALAVFRWRGGKWVLHPRSAERADTHLVRCARCQIVYDAETQEIEP